MKLKKITSALLALMMVLSCFFGMSIDAYAKTSTKNINGIEYTYTVKNGEATIKNIYINDESGFKGTLTLPSKLDGKKVTVIGENALGYYWGPVLKGVKIPDSVVTIGTRALRGANYSSISIGASVKTIKNYAFNPRSISKITVSSKNKSFVVKDGVLFNKKKTVIYLYPAAKKTSKYTMPKTVVEIKPDAFHDANISSIAYSSKLKTIGDSAFVGSNLKSASLPKTVTALGYGAFRACYNLSSVDLSKTKIKKIDKSTFTWSEKIKTIKLPDTVTDIKADAFAYTGISTLKLSSSLKNVDKSAFYAAPVKSYEISSRNKSFKTSDGVLYNKKMTTLVSYPQKKASATFTAPKTVTKVAYCAFAHTSKIKTADFSKSRIKSIDKGAFEYSSVTTVKNPATLESIGEFAFGRSKITKVNFTKNLKTIDKEAFSSSAIKTADLSKTKLTSINNYTFAYTKLESVKLPSTLTKIGACAFYNTKLASVTIPKSVESVGSCAFAECGKLMDVYVKGSSTKFNSMAFYNGKYEEYDWETDTTVYNYPIRIHAKKGSTAEKFANKYNFKFVEM